MDVNSVVNNFYSGNFDAFNRFVPLRNNYKSNCQSHYPHKIRRLFSKKCTAWKQFHTFRTQELLAKYKSIASQCRSAIYAQHVGVLNKVIDSYTTNKFYRYANRKFTNKSLIATLKYNDGSLLFYPTCKDALLQTIFASMFTTDNGHIPAVSTPPTTNTCLSNVILSSELVKTRYSQT